MSNLVVSQVEGSVCDQILQRIFLSPTHSLVIGEGDTLQGADEIREGLDVLRNDGFVAFHWPRPGAREYRLTDNGINRVAQSFGAMGA